MEVLAKRNRKKCSMREEEEKKNETQMYEYSFLWVINK